MKKSAKEEAYRELCEALPILLRAEVRVRAAVETLNLWHGLDKYGVREMAEQPRKPVRYRTVASRVRGPVTGT